MRYSEMKPHAAPAPMADEMMMRPVQPPAQVMETPAPALTNDGGFDRLAVLQDNLRHCLGILDDEVLKGYLTRLSAMPIVAMDGKELAALEQTDDIYFFRITELVYQENEFSVPKFATLFHSMANKPCTLVLMVVSDGTTNALYLGVRAEREEHSSSTLASILQQSLDGLFPGSRVQPFFKEDIEASLKKLSFGSVTSATGIADFQQNVETLDDKKFVQGLEKFIDSMQGKRYHAFFVAENMGREQIQALRREYEDIYTQISPFAAMTLSFSQSKSNASAEGTSESTMRGTSDTESRGTSRQTSEGMMASESTTDSHGRSSATSTSRATAYGNADSYGQMEGTNQSTTDGTSKNVSIGFGVGVPRAPGIGAGGSVGKSSSHSESFGVSHSRSEAKTISETLSHGLSTTEGKTAGRAVTRGTGTMHGTAQGTSEGTAHGVSESSGTSMSRTLSQTFGTSQGTMLNVKNMPLAAMLARLEKQLKRMEACESLGMWNFAAYFVGESAAETESAANIYQSITAGNQSGIACSAIHTWNEPEDVRLLAPYLKHFRHPVFQQEGFSYDGGRLVDVTPAAMVSTNELAIHMGLPRHSVVGLPVVKHAPFAQEVLRRDGRKETISLGTIYHLGRDAAIPVALDRDSLTMHTFITGSTGAGKSNAVYHILSELQHKRIPFLVIEPAKGEYRKVFPDVPCYGTNPRQGALLQLNPFAFPADVHVLEHVDRLVEIFNVCWPMYAAMPAVLKDAIVEAYARVGWDLERSVNAVDDRLFPTFDDVNAALKGTIHSSEYSEETKGDYIGSLATRLKSLTNGINGLLFRGKEMDLAKIFDQSAILDLSRVGSTETKALVMGLMVLKLQEYRMVHADSMNAGLKHVTVLEEAHNLLKKTSTEQSAESSNLAGKSVEMLTNMIAEIRTYGEGFIIVDQAPNLLDTAVLRNTNTKIVLRLPEGTDRQITGTAMALTEQQIQELSKLPTGVAAVYQNDWQEAVLCRLPQFKGQTAKSERSARTAAHAAKRDIDRVLHGLLAPSLPETDAEQLQRDLLAAPVAGRIRYDLLTHLAQRDVSYEWAVADFIAACYQYPQIFQGTGGDNWRTLAELSEIMADNIRPIFADFSQEELEKILYCICRTEHERFPENETIEQLRVEYLKPRVVN
ncbi:ATP-binding protein [uncultured Selenomonas sp.]|uniref:ATP-binding protein n=1 Tax=uncultured Selenomonas sp. TaxID=159275 RepID=UPI00260130F3|nr:DUF87 domain-containing protein [uncultured Selenomonas sp.]